MKYGDTLKQRSIPAWQTHNIDYQDIKHFIKINTTPGKGKAVAIPGTKGSEPGSIEDSLFAILKEQDDRITWFVRSKVGEIHRRLGHLEQQINRFQRQDVQSLPRGHTSIKRIQRYGRIETDILKVGEEIQALSRFIGVQVEAFRKLIKKHKKWTGSSELELRFKEDVRERGTSFASTDLKPYLHKYEELLHTVRALHEGQAAPPSTRRKSNVAQRHARNADDVPSRLAQAHLVLEQGKRVEFDHLMATLTLGQHGRNAAYWVPLDHVVELQVLLLQYMRSFNAMRRQGSTCSIASSNANSPSLGRSHANTADTFNIIADDARAYLTKQAAQNVGSAEAAKERSIQRAALHVRGNGKDDVAMLSWLGPVNTSALDSRTCAVKRKFVDSILGRESAKLARKASVPHLLTEDSEADSTQALQDFRQWMHTHPTVRPITTILSTRARFYSLANDDTGAVLATLDHDISFQSGICTEGKDSTSSKFPYAVLRVRQEGSQMTDLIKVLDDSHLVERVHGFSLEHHAIWQAVKPEDISPPFWIPLLNQDLRKVPRSTSANLKKVSTEFGSQSTTPRMSTATSSETGALSDPRMESLKKGKGKATFTDDELTTSHDPLASNKRRKSYHKSPTQQYWNEYDNPSDDEDAYVIYLDPNEKSIFERLWSSLTSPFDSNHESSKPNERQPLLYSPGATTPKDDEDYESSDDEAGPPANYRYSRIYKSALPDADYEAARPVSRGDRAKAAMKTLPRFTLVCFFASIAILVVAFLLAATGRKKLMREVDAGVIFAVATSLLLSVAGVVHLYRSGDHLRGIVWAAACVELCSVGVASGGLLAWVFA